MKRHWKETDKETGKMKRSSMLRAYAWCAVVMSIFLAGCGQKNNSVNSASDSHHSEYSDVQRIPHEGNDTRGYEPSGFQYDNRMKTSNAEDEYNDRLEDYLDDPEDELRFDPEIFDFQDN